MFLYVRGMIVKQGGMDYVSTEARRIEFEEGMRNHGMGTVDEKSMRWGKCAGTDELMFFIKLMDS